MGGIGDFIKIGNEYIDRAAEAAADDNKVGHRTAPKELEAKPRSSAARAGAATPAATPAGTYGGTTSTPAAGGTVPANPTTPTPSPSRSLKPTKEQIRADAQAAIAQGKAGHLEAISKFLLTIKDPALQREALTELLKSNVRLEDLCVADPVNAPGLVRKYAAVLSPDQTGKLAHRLAEKAGTPGASDHYHTALEALAQEAAARNDYKAFTKILDSSLDHVTPARFERISPELAARYEKSNPACRLRIAAEQASASGDYGELARQLVALPPDARAAALKELAKKGIDFGTVVSGAPAPLQMQLNELYGPVLDPREAEGA